MKMNSFWKMIPVAAFAAFALVACDSGSSSDPGAAESSSSAAAQSSDSSSSGMESNGSSAALSSSGMAKSSSSIAVSSSDAAASSSTAKSSSSVAASSSGAVSSSPQGTVDPSTVVTGTLPDSRDGQVYKTVTIGTQTWMAQNLNYAVDSSWCYENSADSCSKYGRLYTWTAAMGVSSSYNYNDATLGDSVNHQGACPAGWHVPKDAEWDALETTLGGSDSAGTKLKSTSGWKDKTDGTSGNGTGGYGFSALPAGLHHYSGDFGSAGKGARFWSATVIDANSAYNRYLGYGYADMFTGNENKDDAFSVRCVQD